MVGHRPPSQLRFEMFWDLPAQNWASGQEISKFFLHVHLGTTNSLRLQCEGAQLLTNGNCETPRHSFTALWSLFVGNSLDTLWYSVHKLTWPMHHLHWICFSIDRKVQRAERSLYPGFVCSITRRGNSSTHTLVGKMMDLGVSYFWLNRKSTEILFDNQNKLFKSTAGRNCPKNCHSPKEWVHRAAKRSCFQSMVIPKDRVPLLGTDWTEFSCSISSIQVNCGLQKDSSFKWHVVGSYMILRHMSLAAVSTSSGRRNDIYCLQLQTSIIFYPICPLTSLTGRSEAAFFWKEVLQLHESDSANKIQQVSHCQSLRCFSYLCANHDSQQDCRVEP